MSDYGDEKRVLEKIFHDVSDEALEKILSLAQVVSYPRKTMLCKQGEMADTFYVLLAGSVGVYLEVRANNETYQVDTIRESCFGEVALMLNRRRTAFIITKEETKVLELSRRNFEKIFIESPEFARAVSKMVLERLIEQDERKIVRLEAKSTSLEDEQANAILNRLGAKTRTSEESLVMIRETHEMPVKPIWGHPKKDKQYETDIFALMPYSEPYNEIYAEIKDCVQRDLSLRIKRGDETFTNASIMTDIWSVMNASRLILADCSNGNPNVFYELGMAHTLGKPTIILTQTGTVPFDVKGQRYILYKQTLSGMKELQKSLKEAIIKMLDLPVPDET